MPNQHSALAASPTAVIFGANANVVLAPPVAGPLAGATRSMRRVGVSHTAVDVSGDGYVDAIPYDSTGDGRVDALRPLKLGMGQNLSGGV